ncbi:HEAT repeat domain-containing protein [candidate division KSB1 bacterium]|nr:HEAT repeat domain-containing protein [candidate division KSB1 bacterium]
MIKAFLIYLFLFCVLITAAVASQVPADSIRDIVAAAAEYQYGDDPKPLLALSGLITAPDNSPQTLLQIEKAISRVLLAKATGAGRQFLCKQLSLFATEKSVPVLSKMILKPQSAEYARYALERITGSKADKALIGLVKKTGGDTRIGVFNSLGQRRQTGAVNVLKKYLDHDDAGTAQAAVAALGEIASPVCAELLITASKTAKSGKSGHIQYAMIKCADHLLAQDEKPIAEKLYKYLLISGISQTVRAAAFRGTAKCAADNGVMLIKMELQKKESDLKQTAISVMREIPPSDLNGIYADLPLLNNNEQIQMLTAIADRKDKNAIQIVRKAVENKDETVRIAALNTLKVIGEKSDIGLLVSVAVSGTEDEKRAARNCLYLLKGEGVDAKILKETDIAGPDGLVELLKSIGERHIHDGFDILVNGTQNPDPKVRSISIKALEQAAPHEKLGQLVDIMAGLEKSSEQTAMGKTIVAVARKNSNTNRRAAAILERLDSIENRDIFAELLEALGRIEDESALPVLRAALQKENNIKSAAIRALSNWHTDAPLDDLLTRAENEQDEKQQILALRGFIGMIEKTKDDKKVELYKKAMQLATQTNEKRQIFAGLADVPTPDAFQMAAQYIKSDDLSQEASMAAISIGRRIGTDNMEQVGRVMQEIIKESLNERVRNGAQRLLDSLNRE